MGDGCSPHRTAVTCVHLFGWKHDSETRTVVYPSTKHLERIMGARVLPLRIVDMFDRPLAGDDQSTLPDRLMMDATTSALTTQKPKFESVKTDMKQAFKTTTYWCGHCRR